MLGFLPPAICCNLDHFTKICGSTIFRFQDIRFLSQYRLRVFRLGVLTGQILPDIYFLPTLDNCIDLANMLSNIVRNKLMDRFSIILMQNILTDPHNRIAIRRTQLHLHITLLGGVFFCLGCLEVLTGICQSRLIEGFQHHDHILHLRNHLALCGVRLHALIGIHQRLQIIGQVLEPLADLLPQALILLLQVCHHLHHIAICQHCLHRVCHNFFKCGVIVNGSAVFLSLGDLRIHQFLNRYTLLAILLHQEVCQYIELGRGPIPDKVGQLMGDGKQHRALAIGACV